MPHHHHDHAHEHHGHQHGHDHGHHHHAPSSFNRAFAIGIGLNSAFVAIEAFYGWKVGSLALLADAGHNLSDVAGLILAWAGAWAGGLRPSATHSYGFKRFSIVAAFINALLLLLAMGSLGWEAAQRLHDLQPIAGQTVMLVAGIGIVINAATAMLFMRGSEHDLNMRGAYLHMAADALVSAGVVVAGALYLWQGWAWIDPVMSLIIVAVITIGTWGLFKQSVHLLFDGVPGHIHLDEVSHYLSEQPGVEEVHDLHVWAMGTSQAALTAHLIMPTPPADDAFVHRISDELKSRFKIDHSTIQITRQPTMPGCDEADTHHH